MSDYLDKDIFVKNPGVADGEAVSEIPVTDEAGIPEVQVTAYLNEFESIQLTRTHGRREVAFLNRAWEDVLSSDLLVDQSSYRQPILNHAVNSRPCRCFGEDGVDSAQAHLERYFKKRGHL